MAFGQFLQPDWLQIATKKNTALSPRGPIPNFRPQVVGSRARVSEFLREDNSQAFQPGAAPNLRPFRDFLSAATRVVRRVLHLVLDASLPRALCAVSTAPPTSQTRRRCPCPRLRVVSCHPLQLLRRENRPKPKSLRYYSIPIGDPNKARACCHGGSSWSHVAVVGCRNC